eukprot:4502730-Alexandrium_andersonii.AAC.1
MPARGRPNRPQEPPTPPKGQLPTAQPPTRPPTVHRSRSSGPRRTARRARCSRSSARSST